MIVAEFLLNVIANLVSAVLIAALVIAIASSALRRRVSRFFGFKPGRTQQKVYLSSIAVKQGGTIGTTDVVVGFYGAAITEAEYKHALLLSSSIQARPTFRLLQAIQGAAVASAAVADSVRSSIELCPSYREVGEALDLQRHHELRAALEGAFRYPSVIIIGAPIYNSLAFYAMSGVGSFTSRFAFVREERVPVPGGPTEHARGFRIRQAGDADEFIRTTRDDGIAIEYFVIEKIKFKPRPLPSSDRRRDAPRPETTVFLCCGTSTVATSAAVDMLRDWRRLEQRYGLEEFGVVFSIELSNEAEREREPDGAKVHRVYSDPPTEQ